MAFNIVYQCDACGKQMEDAKEILLDKYGDRLQFCPKCYKRILRNVSKEIIQIKHELSGNK